MRIFLFIASFFIALHGTSQDVLFNQFMRCATYTNPALTGTGRDSSGRPGARILSLYRNQWSLPSSNPYRTNYLGYDQMVSDGFGSLGAYFLYDAAGKEGAFQTTQLNVTYAYSIPIARGRYISRFGLSLGYKHLAVDFAKLKFEDQIDYTRGVVRKTTEIQTSLGDDMIDVNVGGVFHSADAFVGVSVHNLSKPNYQMTSGLQNEISPRISLITGKSRVLADSNTLNKSMQIYGAISKQNDHWQLNLCGYYKMQILALGLGYRFNRTIQFQSDALIVTCMIDVKNFNFYYGFEYTLSALRAFAPVSHEVGLQVPLTIGKFYRQRYRSRGYLPFPM